MGLTQTHYVKRDAEGRIPNSPMQQPKPNDTNLRKLPVGTTTGGFALSRSSAASSTQAEGPVRGSGTSANAEVPANSQPLAVKTPPIVPLPAHDALVFLGVKRDIEAMKLDEKFDCLKQCFAHGYGVRKVLCAVFESIRAEFKTYAKDRAGMPTVEEAFTRRGLNYKTIYSAIQREKDRRTQDAEFFAAIKAHASTTNIHGLDITDDDLPPVGTKVLLSDGTKGQILAIGQKVAPDSERSFEIVTEEGIAVQIKRGDLITFAEREDSKVAERAEKVAKALEAQDDGSKREEAKTKRIAAAAAKKDHAAKSDSLYAAQYFNLLAIINAAPKEFTPSEFTQTVMEHLQVAYQALGEDAQRVTRASNLFPTIARGNESDLLTFLSTDAVGHKSPINAVFGGIGLDFRSKIEKFAQRICDKVHEGKFHVTVTDKAQASAKAKKMLSAQPAHKPKKPTGAPALESDRLPITKVGDKSIPSPHGLFIEFRMHDKLPYVLRDANNLSLGILCECNNKTEAEFKLSTYEREATALSAAI